MSSRNLKVRDFEKRFATMDVEELQRWKAYWTLVANGLAPKIRKQAMMREYEVDKAIAQRSAPD